MGRAMTSGDIKGDTARGARYLANRQAKQQDKSRKVAPAKSAKGNGHAKAEVLDSLGIVPQWQTVPELKQLHFGSLVEKRTQLRDEIKFREAKVKELDEEIMAAFAVSGLEKVEWEDRPVQVVHGKSASKVVPEKLISLGVSPDVIAASTEPGKEFSYILVGKAK